MKVGYTNINLNTVRHGQSQNMEVYDLFICEDGMWKKIYIFLRKIGGWGLAWGGGKKICMLVIEKLLTVNYSLQMLREIGGMTSL